MSEILQPVYPGQIYVKRGTAGAFAEVTDIKPEDMYSMLVYYRPIIEDNDSEIKSITETLFHHDFFFCFDLAAWLKEFFNSNPRWLPPQLNNTREVKIHQIWSPINNRTQFYRVTQVGHIDSDKMSMQRIVHKFSPRKELFSKNNLLMNYVLIMSIMDVLNLYVNEVHKMQRRLKEIG